MEPIKKPRKYTRTEPPIKENQKELVRLFLMDRVEENNGCWLWKDTAKYADATVPLVSLAFLTHNRHDIMPAHRIMWYCINNDPKIPRCLLRKEWCPNNTCINPHHFDASTSNSKVTSKLNDYKNLRTHMEEHGKKVEELTAKIDGLMKEVQEIRLILTVAAEMPEAVLEY